MTAQGQLTLVDPLADAVSWAKTNPDAFLALIDWATQDREAGITPSMDAYGHLLRRPHMANRLGLRRPLHSPVLFNNDLTSGLARLINRSMHQDLFPTRKAKADGWGAVG